MFKMAILLFKENTCANLFSNPSDNIGVMAHKSSFMWPSRVTLTFNLPKKCFKWHYSSSRIIFMFIFYSKPQSLGMFVLVVAGVGGVNIMYKCFKCHFYSSRNTNVQNYSEIHALIQKKWPRQAQFMTILSFDLQECPWLLTFPNKCFKWHYYSSRRTPVQNYF